MAEVFSASRINLGMPWVLHSSRIPTLKGRDFEVPMAGGLYLTGYSDELSRHYRIGEEIVCYTSPQECVDIIRALLDQPKPCRRIRAAGHRRAMQHHTWDARFRRLFAFLGLLDESDGDAG
jgi:spore maturation protein CgeB